MPIPTPERGLVISYAYVWDHEAPLALSRLL